MARVHHRIFEIYEHRDEAGQSLISKSAQQSHEAIDPRDLTFNLLQVTREAIVICAQFKQPPENTPEATAAFRKDLDTLGENLVRGSKVLLDFSQVEEFSAASVETLDHFRKQLQPEGSRLVLCCLSPALREVFFQPPPKQPQPARNSNNRSRRKPAFGRN